MNRSHEHQRKLCAKAKRGDRKAADELVRLNMAAIYQIALRVVRGGVEVDDLVNEGAIGMLHAIQKYDPKVGTTFLTYAHWWIRSAMVRWLDIERALLTGTQALQANLGMIPQQIERLIWEGWDREAAHKRVAKMHGIKVERLYEMLEGARMRRINIDARRTSQFGRGDQQPLSWHELLPSGEPLPGEDIDAKRKRKAVREAAAKADLTERERIVLNMRLLTLRPATLEEVGEKLFLSKERIRQIETVVLRKLKEAFLADPVLSEVA